MARNRAFAQSLQRDPEHSLGPAELIDHKPDCAALDIHRPDGAGGAKLPVARNGQSPKQTGDDYDQDGLRKRYRRTDG